MPVRTVIEHGPKDKRSVAFSLDWLGWSRGARSAELALDKLESYRERYRPVARLAGMSDEFDAAGPLEVVEDKVGTGSTDFWGMSFAPAAAEPEPMDEASLQRGITLLRACWAFFDGCRCPGLGGDAQGPARRRTRPDRIIRHTIRVESEDFAKQIGLHIPEEGALTPPPWSNTARHTSRRCARTTPARSRSACGDGTCRTSSAIRPTTRSTTHGRWRTRTSRPDFGTDPSAALVAVVDCNPIIDPTHQTVPSLDTSAVRLVRDVRG